MSWFERAQLVIAGGLALGLGVGVALRLRQPASPDNPSKTDSESQHQTTPAQTPRTPRHCGCVSVHLVTAEYCARIASDSPPPPRTGAAVCDDVTMEELMERWTGELTSLGLIDADIVRVTTTRGATVASPMGLRDGEILFCWRSNTEFTQEALAYASAAVQAVLDPAPAPSPTQATRPRSAVSAEAPTQPPQPPRAQPQNMSPSARDRPHVNPSPEIAAAERTVRKAQECLSMAENAQGFMPEAQRLQEREQLQEQLKGAEQKLHSLKPPEVETPKDVQDAQFRLAKAKSALEMADRAKGWMNETERLENEKNAAVELLAAQEELKRLTSR